MPSKHKPDPHCVFQHGWGFDGTCWREWLALLANRPCFVGNRGYWGDPAPFDDTVLLPGFVLICHSLGLHFLTQEIISQASLLVVISGFAHFHGQNATDGRFTRKHVKRMLSRVQSDPTGLVADFYRDCGCIDWPVDQKPMDTTLLTQDLMLLDQGRVEEKHFAELPAVLLLHGREDRIVRPERANELTGLFPRSRLLMIDGAGHGLPFTHPRLCLDLICSFYQESYG